MEEVLPEMVDLDPVSIGLVMILPDGTTGTSYFNCDTTDMKLMATAIEDDRQIDWIKANADYIAQILAGEEDDEDGLCEPDTEADSEG